MTWKTYARRFWAAVVCKEHGWKTTHFWGPAANWALVGSAVYDGLNFGPEMISPKMTATMCVYSGLFMRFAWMVGPRNYLLFACHFFNFFAQLNQMRRCIAYKQSIGEDLGFTQEDMYKVGAGVAVAAVGLKFAPALQNGLASMGEGVKSVVMHPAGPFTIFFWAPTTKWGLSGSNIADYDRPVDKVSTSQQLSLAATGLIWSRYSFVITPVNYNLFLVNFVLACTSLYHVARKVKAYQEIPAASA
eukprot:TRINITY_DN3801_c0_g1_i1.p1 TRINITY_DN3801_c0_g1~~TRINITY_DN3801_c0_g1_i1.p1  ORF type:complete len:246 (+),score=107.55 TRINITY_DN3801_c0_g1_i1:72-809(+)